MTDEENTQPTPSEDPVPAPIFDLAAWQKEHDDYNRRFIELLLENKTALFNVLAAAGIAIVDVTFDGYGDSGQIESIEAKGSDSDKIIDLPSVQIEIVTPIWGRPNVDRQTFSVGEAIEHLAYAFLRETHCGWENNDGAYGDFTFDVADRTISLDYHERYTETNYSHHSF
jgi:hypothetical protein